MPKLIPEAKATLLAAAKQQLFAQGYAGFTLRGLAAQCDVAVGTIYNYFPGKEMLVASVMAEDWLSAIEGMRRGCAAAAAVEQGVRAVYEGIVAFTAEYAPIWAEYNGAPSGFGERHVMLRNQLSELLCALLTRLGRAEDAHLCPLLAETVLTAAMQKDIGYPMLSEAVKRLFP